MLLSHMACDDREPGCRSTQMGRRGCPGKSLGSMAQVPPAPRREHPGLGPPLQIDTASTESEASQRGVPSHKSLPRAPAEMYGRRVVRASATVAASGVRASQRGKSDQRRRASRHGNCWIDRARCRDLCVDVSLRGGRKTKRRDKKKRVLDGNVEFQMKHDGDYSREDAVGSLLTVKKLGYCAE